MCFARLLRKEALLNLGGGKTGDEALKGEQQAYLFTFD
jgi:hypothetical protein